MSGNTEEKRKPGRPFLPPGEKMVVVPIRLTEAQKAKLAALGGAAWLRAKIDKARLTE